jgi:hypothetical protein
MTAKVLNTVRQHAEKNPAFSQSSLRNLIFNAKANGFDACLVRVGRKILIDEAAFFQWIDSQNGKRAA